MTQLSASQRFRGKSVLLAMAALAAALAGGLYWIAASDTPAEYRQSKPGAPPGPMRVATVDMQWEAGVDTVSTALRGAKPDIVLVQHATRDTLVKLAEGLEMLQPEHLFYCELGGDGRTSGGCGIISRHRLYRHRELRDGTRDAFAVAAEVVVEGRRFLLISTAIGGANMVDQAEVLRKTIGLLRIGPLVCAGQAGATPPLGLRALTVGVGDAIYGSEHWGTRASGRSGRVAWVEIAAAREPEAPGH